VCDGGLASAPAPQILFALIFTAARMVAGLVLTYYTVINPDSHIIVKGGAVGILVVSLLWFNKIVGMVTRALKKKGHSKKA
jgi:hypothetical protein